MAGARFMELIIDKSRYSHYGLGFLNEKNTVANKFIDHYIIAELNSLQNMADKKGIPILIFKGLIEKYDTYLSYDLYRDQWDIDILVSIDDIYSFCEICNKMGYSTYNGSIDDNWVSINLTELNNRHLAPIFKYLFGGAFRLTLEIHTVINTKWNYENDRGKITREILLRRCKMETCEGLYGMDVIDRFLFSLFYFSNDYLAPALSYYYCPDNLLFRCKTLVDASLILEKYQNDLDISALIERIGYYGIACNVLFSVEMLSKIFVIDARNVLKRIIEGCESMLKQPSELSFENKVLYSAYKACTVFRENNDIDFYKKVIENCLCLNKQIVVPKNRSIELSLLGSTLAKAFISWEDTAMTISINIMKESLMYFEDVSSKYDCMNIRIYNPAFDFALDNAVRNIFVCIKQGNVADVTFNGAEPTVRGKLLADSITAACVRGEDSFIVSINIPWSVQNINPLETKHIGFECTIGLYNNDNRDFIYWSNNKAPHYNPAKFGKVILSQ